MIDATKKHTSEAFNKNIYYLGKEADGQNIWLEDFKWDCEWYWGGGYLETYTNNNAPHNSRDISSHTHFDGLSTIEKVEFVELKDGSTKTIWDRKSVNLFDGFKARIVETPLTDDELWRLCDLMQSFYTLRESAEWFKNGKSNYTSIKGSKARPDTQKLCNKIIEEEIAPKVRELLTP